MVSLQTLLKTEKSLILPVAHDAISARIIERVGFKAYAIGGFGVVASRFGYPDFAIASYREMRDAVIEISRAVSLPVLVDADGGYGDILNVERTIVEYEREEQISCIFLEDQVHPKRCGHLRGKQLIRKEEMVRKLRVAVATRSRHDLLIMARTDARSVEGLEEALRRAEAYLHAGADMIFIESPESSAELERIGRSFKGVPLLVNMLEGGKTPIVSRKDLEAMGYALIAYPVTTVLLMAGALERGLAQLKKAGDSRALMKEMASLKSFKELIGVQAALSKEETYVGQ